MRKLRLQRVCEPLAFVLLVDEAAGVSWGPMRGEEQLWGSTGVLGKSSHRRRWPSGAQKGFVSYKKPSPLVSPEVFAGCGYSEAGGG